MRVASRFSRPVLFRVFLLSLAAVMPWRASADVLTNTDVAGFSSFTSGVSWASGIAPTNGTTYSTTNLTLRTPDAVASVTFAGDSLAIDAGGTLALKAASGGTVTITNLILNGGTVAQWTAAASATFAGKFTVSNSSTLSPASTTNTGLRTMIVSAPISGPGGLTVSDTLGVTNFGVVVFGASNNLASSVNVSQGTLSLSNVYALSGATSATVTNGAAVQANLNSAYQSAPLTIMGAGPVSTPNGGSLFFNNTGAATVTWPGAITLNPTSTIASYGVTYVISLTNAIGGAGPLTISSRGGSTASHTATWTLGGPNTYSGNTTLQNNDGLLSATFKIATTNSLPTATALTLSTQGAGSNTVFDLNGNDQTLAGVADGTNPTRAQIRNSSSTAPSALTVNNSANYVYSGAIGVGGTNLQLVKNGSGNLTLFTTANTYSRGTLINNGNLVIGNGGNENAGALGSGLVSVNTNVVLWMQPGSTGNGYSFPNSFVLNGGTIRGEDGNQHLATGAGATFAIGAAGGAVQASWSGKDVFIDGIITGTGALTLSHGTTAGQLSAIHITNPSNTCSGTVSVSGAGTGITLNLDTAAALQFATLNLNPDTPGTVILTVTNGATVAGLTGTAGTLKPTTAAGTYTLTANNTNDFTYGGTLINNTGTLALRKTGVGTQTLNGVSTYTGPTTVSAGTLVLGAAGSLSNSAVTVQPGATMLLNGKIAAGPVNVSGLLTMGANGAANNSIITVNAGGMMDVSAVSGGFTMSAAQTIQGNGTVTGQLSTVDASAQDSAAA